MQCTVRLRGLKVLGKVSLTGIVVSLTGIVGHVGLHKSAEKEPVS